MYRETRTEYAVLSPDTTPPSLLGTRWRAQRFQLSDMSTAIVLVAGQNETGGLGRASGQSAAESASRLSSGGSAGENSVPSASTIDFTDSSVTGHSPV